MTDDGHHVTGTSVMCPSSDKVARVERRHGEPVCSCCGKELE